MRWDNLRADADGAQGALFDLDQVVERTFETPEFSGMTFYEVRARSIVNRVPAASRMPFGWTINPYRGCSHACVYCLDGDTDILMADGRCKALRDVRPGDAVIGTVEEAGRRRCTVTAVLDHWQTMKPAYQVSLVNGARLIASAEHRFLTDDGWRHVAGVAGGPVLSTRHCLVGVGRPASPGLRIRAVQSLGYEMPMYDITTGTGDFIANGVVSHNCFARRTHEYLDLDAGADFDSKVVVKVNAPELLGKELAAPGWRGEHIAMGTNVDCYQRAEGRYRLMRPILETLADHRNPFSILTKGTLVSRDLDLLTEAATRTQVSVSVSVGSVDEEIWRQVEPGTPAPRARLDVCRALTEAGIGCGVLMAPILPMLTDSPEKLEATVRSIARAGARSVSPIVLHLRPGAREWYFAWLARTRPDLVDPYRTLYGSGSHTPKAYQRHISQQVAELARRHGVGRVSPGRARRGAVPSG